MPAASVAVTPITVPAGSGVDGVYVHAPLGSAVTVASGVPSPFVSMLTVAPASAVPDSDVPSVAFTVGNAGAVVSIVRSKAVLGTLTLPAVSVAVTVIECAPSPKPVVGVNVQFPDGSAVVVPNNVVPSYTLTVLPASAVPLNVGVASSVLPPEMIAPTTEPTSSVTVPMTGAPGAVVSPVTVTDADGPVLPAASVAVTPITVPAGSGVEGVYVHAPLGSAVTVASGVPSPFVSMLTVAPASAVPDNDVPSVAFTVGIAGAVVSIVRSKAVLGTLTLPAASVAVTVRLCAPLPKPVVGVNVQFPDGSAVVVPSNVVPSYTLTVLPASAVPLNVGVASSVLPPEMIAPTTEPTSSVTVPMTGAPGAVVSPVTVTDADGPVLPAASVAVTPITVPIGSGVDGVYVHAPLGSAVTVASGVPSPFVSMLTVAPASAVPDSDVPSVAFTVGNAGAVVSIVSSKAVLGTLTLPAVSVAVTVIECAPSPKPVVGVNVQFPDGSAVVVPNNVVPSYTLTVLPASAVPLNVGVASSVLPPEMIAPTTEPTSSVTVPMTGAPGAVVSPVTVTEADGPVLPAASVAVTPITVPAGSGVEGVYVHAPLGSAVTVASGVPSPFVSMLTVAPTSAVPDSDVPSVAFTVGSAGAVVSIVSSKAALGVLTLPAASVAVTVIECAPSPKPVVGVNVHFPDESAVVVPSSVVPSYTLTLLPASAVPPSVGVVSLVAPPIVTGCCASSLTAVIAGVSGTIVSTTIPTVLSSLVLPLLSVCVTVT
ncbi:uncharacterized protein BCN122_II2490 [Burkholderia cenocepacia]|nr:uncharacterized protein BCN122_II2490 [Burkholderia cenocepacia]